MMLLIGMQLIVTESLMACARRLEYESEGTEMPCCQVHPSVNSFSDWHQTTTIPLNYECAYQYNSYYERLLLLASDVELNPGPLTDKDEILQAISASKEDVLREMKMVKDDIFSIKQEVAGIRTEQRRVRSDISDIHQIQHELEVRITTLETNVKSLKRSNKRLQEENEILQLDVDEVIGELEKKSEIIDNLDNDIDRLEAYSRRDTLRVFGLPELANESYEMLKGYVISSVLNVACPLIDWRPEDIIRTHRVGKKDPSNVESPRILLIKFLHWDRKMAVFRGRETLREYGIRIGDDITRRQRDSLKRLSDQGKSGYFYKGELFVRDRTEKHQGDSERDNHGHRVIHSRTFVKALRKTVPVPDMVTSEASVDIDSSGHVTDFRPGTDVDMTLNDASDNNSDK